jgi:probable rRNA maturation factor
MRELTLTNRHPRLRLDRRTLAKALAHLDAYFRVTSADLPTLSPAGRRRARAIRLPAPNASAIPAGELSVSFLADSALAKLHAAYLDDPTTTDVITFEGDEALGHAGDICVSVDTALAYSEKHQVPFAEELLRYVIHGWLHLAGYDDLHPKKKRRLRAAEDRALKLLRTANLLPAFTLRPPPHSRSLTRSRSRLLKTPRSPKPENEQENE